MNTRKTLCRRHLLSALFVFAAVMVLCPDVFIPNSTSVSAEAASKKKKSSSKSSKSSDSSKKSKKSKKKKKKKKVGKYKKNGSWYINNENGKHMKGFIEYNGKIYYANKKGVLQKGWQTIKGKEYYFQTTGSRKTICSAYTGVKTINGIKVKFSKKGAFVKCVNAVSGKDFVSTFGEKARINQMKTGLSAVLTMAQAILESNYGKSSLAVNQHNLFGIRSGVNYRSYASDDESLADYTAFIEQYFPSLFGVTDWAHAIYVVGHGGYAEASNYYSSLMGVVSANNLTRFAC